MNDVKEQSVLSSEQLQEISSMILREAAKRGASQAEVSVGANKGFTVNAREADLETIEYHQDKEIDITVYFGQRSGSSSITDIRPEAINDAIEAACHIAKYTSEDPASGLADKEDLAFDYPEIDMYYPWEVSVTEASELACQCEREALAYDKRIFSAESASVSTTEARYVYANSLGFNGEYAFTRHDMSCVLVAKDENGLQRDYAYTAATNPEKLVNAAQIAKEAAQRTVQRLGARRLKTMKAPVIFLNEEARGLLGHFEGAIQGGRLYRKSSFLLDHIGKQVFPDFVQIQEHPHIPGAMGSVAFDGNGVATRDNVFIENGILQSYSLSVYSSRKLGLKTTGNCGGTHNLTINHGDKNLQQLMKAMGKGLLVTEVIGQGVNLLTGDYSRGISGYWVENGEIQYPVHEVTIAGKLQDIFMGIVEVGNDVDTRGNIRTGSILINEMMIGGE